MPSWPLLSSETYNCSSLPRIVYALLAFRIFRIDRTIVLHYLGIWFPLQKQPYFVYILWLFLCYHIYFHPILFPLNYILVLFYLTRKIKHLFYLCFTFILNLFLSKSEQSDIFYFYFLISCWKLYVKQAILILF